MGKVLRIVSYCFNIIAFGDIFYKLVIPVNLLEWPADKTSSFENHFIVWQIEPRLCLVAVLDPKFFSYSDQTLKSESRERR